MAKLWVRLWLDMPTDPKFRTIARRSGQPLSLVIAVYAYMLTIAANAEPPGSIEKMVFDDAASAMDCDESAVQSIVDAMQGKVLDGYNLTGWKARQPEREDNSRERVAKHREAKKAGSKPEGVTHGNATVTDGNAPDTDTDTDTDLSKDPNNSLKYKDLASGSKKSVSANGEAVADVELAKKMFSDVVANYPKSKAPNFQAWAKTIRLMRESDGHSTDTIKDLWAYTQNKSEFWRDVVRSPQCLRRNIERIDIEKGRTSKQFATPGLSKSFLDQFAWLKTAKKVKDKLSGNTYNLETDYGYGEKVYWGRPGLINRRDDRDRIPADCLEAVTDGN